MKEKIHWLIKHRGTLTLLIFSGLSFFLWMRAEDKWSKADGENYYLRWENSDLKEKLISASVGKYDSRQIGRN